MRHQHAFLVLVTAVAACSNGNAAAGPGADVRSIDGAATAHVTTCESTISGSTHANVKVPAGSTCGLDNVTVQGNVIALEGARVSVRGSHVRGNIQGEKAAVVRISGGVVDGSIQIQDGSSPGEDGVSITDGTLLTQGNIQITKMRTGRIIITDAVVEKGNVQLQENEVSSALDVRRNRVAQNLEVRKHRTGAVKTVSNNTVGQKLTCDENSSPFVVSANTARDSDCP